VANSEGYLDIRRNIIGDFEENYPGPCRVYIVSRFKDGQLMLQRLPPLHLSSSTVVKISVLLRLLFLGRPNVGEHHA
jgi:hypothetical protein